MLNAKQIRLIRVLEINFTKSWQMLGNIREVTTDSGNSRETSAISPEQKGWDGKNKGGF